MNTLYGSVCNAVQLKKRGCRKTSFRHRGAFSAAIPYLRNQGNPGQARDDVSRLLRQPHKNN